MKRLSTILIFICFINFSAVGNGTDSLHLFSLKLLGNGSLVIVKGWEPKTGRFYSSNWSDKDAVSDHSIGFQYGLIVSKRLFGSSFYLATGAALSSYIFNSFRTTSAPDLRQPHSSFTDVSYNGYELKALHIPVFFQIPLSKRKIYFSLRAGVFNDYTIIEKYNILYTEYNPGAHTSSQYEAFENSSFDFTATRLHIGLDFEFYVPDSRIIPFLSLNQVTGPLSKDITNKNFLRYSTAFSIAMGLGFGIGKK